MDNNNYFMMGIVGAVALIATIILTAVIVIISIAIAFVNISSRLSTFHLFESERVYISTDACIEEVLIQLNRDNTITSKSIQIDDVNCLATISGTGDTRSLSVRGQNGKYLHDINLDVRLSPSFAIINWEE
jgi:hypothetical protein